MSAIVESVPPRAAASRPLTRRQRFLAACHCQPLDYPPIWLMRQAGRALPEYRALKQKYSFLEMVQTPELAAEVTLQPIRRFDFDAAILFCDILVIAEGLGQPYSFDDQRGIQMQFTLKDASDIGRLQPEAVTQRLQYVAQSLRIIKSALTGRTALLGFAGSPWTLANFMIEGGGAHTRTKARNLFVSDPPLFNSLMEKLTRAVADFLKLQIDAGADAVQIFDSLGGELSAAEYGAASGRWIHQIVEALDGKAPAIVFAKGVHRNWKELVDTGAQVVSVDHGVPLSEVRHQLPTTVAMQGNLDPKYLCDTSENVAIETRRILSQMRGRPGHIFNLGHGVPPEAKIECIETLVKTVRETKAAP